MKDIRLKKCLRAIVKLNEKGYAPSVREILEELPYKSTRSVSLMLADLEKAGYIERTLGKSRSIRVLKVM